MDAIAGGDLVNLISISSSHSVLLLCPDEVQLAQQLRWLTWAVLGVSAVRAAAGVTEVCSFWCREGETETQSLFDLQQHCTFVPLYVCVCRCFFFLSPALCLPLPPFPPLLFFLNNSPACFGAEKLNYFWLKGSVWALAEMPAFFSL